MADNYLERKMEEYRNGASRKSVRKVSALGCAPGVWRVPFAERRVLIAGSGLPVEALLVEQLRSVGCKVAFMGSDKTDGIELARKTGAQYHPVCYDDAEAMERSVALVCRSWGDIDVIITTLDCFPEPIAKAWRDFRENKPYANEYGGRIVAIGSASLPCEYVLKALRDYGIVPVRVNAESDGAMVASSMMAMLCRASISF